MKIENTITPQPLTTDGPSILHQVPPKVLETTDIELPKVLENAKQIIQKLTSFQVLSPVEGHNSIKNNISNEDNQTKNADNFQREKTPIAGPIASSGSFSHNEYNDSHSNQEIVNTMYKLMNLLDYSNKQIQQLKFKNMMLASSETERHHRQHVEENIQKQEFERIKSQLLSEKKMMIERIRATDTKVRKYKKRIMEKNIEINRLTRLLNDSTLDVTQLEVSSTEYTNSTTSSARMRTPDHEKNKEPGDMLRTLGVLASQVLNDDTEEISINRTILQSATKPENHDNSTEAEISYYQTNESIHNGPLIAGRKFNSIPILPEIKPINEKPAQIPRLRSFNTIDGSVKDIL